MDFPLGHGVERHRPERRRYSRAPLAYVTGGGATGGSPRRNIGGVNLVSLPRSLADHRLLRMARETYVIRAGSKIGRKATGAHDQCKGGCDEQLLHLLYP
jgi:hypothetical protein